MSIVARPARMRRLMTTSISMKQLSTSNEVVGAVLPPYRILSIAAFMLAALAVGAGYSYTRFVLEASSRSKVAAPLDLRALARTARFRWLVGSVKVKRAGTLD